MAAKLEDSNIALLGSDIEKQVKKAAAQCAREWDGAGKEVGVEVWRVEKFQIRRWPRDKYGSFFDGDSYIVLKTYKRGDEPKLLFNVHFWLGQNTSQDEAGTAAYKTVELDTLLDGAPVQFREVQGFESPQFLACFRNVTILKGGVDSGFNHVKPETFAARLLHFKGRRQVRVVQVPLARASLNEGDVFVLDAGLRVWTWAGRASGPMERNRGEAFMKELRDQRQGKPRLAFVSQGEEDGEFWQLLGGAGPVAPASAGGDDAEAERKIGNDTALYRVNDRTGFQLVARGPLSKSQLDPMDVMLLDSGIALHLWVGRGASASERARAMFFATNYLQTQKRPFHTPVQRLVQGGETDEFLAAFTAPGELPKVPSAAEAAAAKAAPKPSGGPCCRVA